MGWLAPGQHGQSGVGGHGHSGPQSQLSVIDLTSFRDAQVGIDPVGLQLGLEPGEPLVEVVELDPCAADRVALGGDEGKQVVGYRFALAGLADRRQAPGDL